LLFLQLCGHEHSFLEGMAELTLSGLPLGCAVGPETPANTGPKENIP
jgi:hypothetical protein